MAENKDLFLGDLFDSPRGITPKKEKVPVLNHLLTNRKLFEIPNILLRLDVG
jgi:hypothetical protein